MKRQHQVLLIASTLALCWLAMQAVHELGHILAAVASGGSVEQVILHPLAISQTRTAASPYPVLVVWMGPIVGILLPIAVLAIARSLRWRYTFLLQFFAGFCLIANGAYLAFGSFNAIGDAGDLLKLGTPVWLLWLFGAVTMPIGLWLWNGLGPHFGLGRAAGQVDTAVAYLAFALLVFVLVFETLFFSTTVP